MPESLPLELLDDLVEHLSPSLEVLARPQVENELLVALAQTAIPLLGIESGSPPVGLAPLLKSLVVPSFEPVVVQEHNFQLQFAWKYFLQHTL